MGIAGGDLLLCHAELEYVSIGCNRSPQVLDWGRHGQIAYGGSNSVIIYQPECRDSAGKIVSILNGHKGRVNCVHWIENDKGKQRKLLSGSSDKTVILWGQEESKWEAIGYLVGHTEAVCCVTGIMADHVTDSYLIISSAADSTVRVWYYEEEKGVSCMQVIKFGNGFCLSLAVTMLPRTEVPFLACGCDDTKIHLYALKREETVLEVNCIAQQRNYAQERIKCYFEKVQTLQGHEDWIRCLDFTVNYKGDLMLASGAQDCFIRIWKIEQKHGVEDNKELKLPEKIIQIVKGSDSVTYTVVLETVLAGHEGWVYGVCWQKYSSFESQYKQHQQLCLLSASMDKTVMLWQPEEDSQLWIDKARMGDVGGNTLGFYGCAFSPDGTMIIGHGFQGAFHLWRRHQMPEDNWRPDVTIGGHFGSVEDFDWDPDGSSFLISVSSDQTARLHGPWIRENKATTWHEIARPQIHGYDLQCIKMINRYLYAAGAEEKVIRIFRAPRKFHESLSVVCQVQETNTVINSLPLGASVPPLGLSNKAVFEGDLKSWKVGIDDTSQPMKASAFASEDPLPFTPVTITVPPQEDLLLQNTLWPEEQKLYGHGYEIFCLASDPEGTVLASACKASKEEHANIILWDTSSWRQLGSLVAHSLTVTQMAFSHHGNWLLSVSRDRTWSLFVKKQESIGCPYELYQKADKKTSKHSRIIWSCCWTHDDKYFITGSRDKKVNVWGLSDQYWQVMLDPYTFEDAVTAVAASPGRGISGRYTIAVGMENGKISILDWGEDLKPTWQLLTSIPHEYCPTLSVKRLKWKEEKDVESHQGNRSLHLGVASTDCSIRILKLQMNPV